MLNFRGPLLVEMKRRGHDILVLAPDHDETTRAALRQIGVEPVDFAMSRTGTNPLADAGTLLQLCKLLRRHRPEVSLAYFIKPVIYGSITAWLAGVPRRYAMIEGLGFAFSKDAERTWRRSILFSAVLMLFRLALFCATRIIFLNPDDRAEFLQRELVAKDKTDLLGGIGVDLSEWRARSGLAPARTTFILVARLLRDKGIEEYFAAARLVRKDYPDTRFILVGEHDKNPAAVPMTLIRQWVDEGIVEWPGFVAVRPWLEQASVFVLPSYREGVPRSTQEAMAVGLPVITTDVPGCRETVVHGVNGFLIPPRDPSSLADAMRRFIENPDLIASMGVAGRRMAEERFDVHQQNDKLLRMIGL